MAGRAANQIGAEEKVHSPTVTMATDKGRRCRAELGKGGRKDGGKEREAGEKEVSPSFFYPSCSLLCSLSTYKVISTGYNIRNGGEGEWGG